jgi:hypothetical protein
VNTQRTFAAYALAAIFAANDLRAGESKPADANIMPLIVIGDVPLSDAIRNIARQMNLNFILDPCVPGASPPAAGRKVREPGVNIRLENQTVEYALNLILKNHGLTLISNPVTTVARIVPIDHHIKPVPATEVGSDTNAVPVITLDNVTLSQAIEHLTKSWGLNAVFDSTFLKSPYGRDTAQLYVRWTNITPRQALAALLDNYDLAMIENPTNTSAFVITLKASNDPAAHGKEQPRKKRGLSLF